MQITIQAFGIARDILGTASLPLSVDDGVTVKAVKDSLLSQFPDFAKLASLRVAVNTEYADDDTPIHANDEIVLIPPVSGG